MKLPTGHDTKRSVAAVSAGHVRLSPAVLTARPTRVKQRLPQNWELEDAREVQQQLLPRSGPVVAGLDYGGQCRPAASVGGDYYDFLPIYDGRLGFAIGDVSGKGIPAALLMATLQASLRGLAISSPPALPSLMASLNRLMYEATPSNRFATVFYGAYDPLSREFAYVNGGHNPPMVLRGSQVLRLKAGGPAIGYSASRSTSSLLLRCSREIPWCFTPMASVRP